MFFETLTMMAVGGHVGVCDFGLVLKFGRVYLAGCVGDGVAAGVPTLPPVLRWFGAARGWDGSSRRMTLSRKRQGSAAEAECRFAWDYIWRARYGLGRRVDLLGAVRDEFVGRRCARSVLTMLQLLDDMPVLITAVAFAVVAGFLSMLPGGLLCAMRFCWSCWRRCAARRMRLVAAVLMRLVWLVSEVVACGILYIGEGAEVRGRDREQGTQ